MYCQVYTLENIYVSGKGNTYNILKKMVKVIGDVFKEENSQFEIGKLRKRKKKVSHYSIV